MKKRTAGQTLVVLLACAVCVGVTSCGDDPAPQPAETIAVVPPSAAVTVAAPSPTDDWTELERLRQLAQQPEADFLASARAWAGNTLKRKLWACALAQRAGRMVDLVALARDARAACSGADATFGHFCAVARYFKACASFDEAREALTQAIPLADTQKRRTEVAVFWRSLQ